MPHLAVLGSPIEHSLSPVLHTAGFSAAGLRGWEYARRETTAEQMPALMEQAWADDEWRGFSVTMPGKMEALRHAHTSSERARVLGAANTLIRGEQGWHADNTDVEGVYGGLGALGVTVQDRPVVVIGGGGTARSAVYALKELGADTISLVNRSDRTAEMSWCAQLIWVSWQETEAVAHACANAAVVISTVPSAVLEGAETLVAQAPVFDVIYDPWPTPLVRTARAAGLPAIGGLSMLAYQAFSQFEQFTGKEAPRQAMVKALATQAGVEPGEITGKR